jgi:flavin-dependent dehydrogenase
MPITVTDHTIRGSHDVVVVGARCAGAATAMLLARQGYDVLVVDRATFPSDTLSTHAIARTGVVQLDRWGLLGGVLYAGAPAIRQVVFHSDAGPIVKTIKDRAGVDLLVAPRRHVLDQIMLDAAQEAGARVLLGATVDGVLGSPDTRVTGVHGRIDDLPFEATARFVVGADGLRSRVARSVGAPIVESRPAETALHYAYYSGLEWGPTEYYPGDGAFAGIFPTNDGEACIWVCNHADEAEAVRRAVPSPVQAFDRLMAEGAPALADRLRAATRTSPVRSAVRFPNQLRQPVGSGWALVGDAGYHRDPITGHGISDAFQGAELLADALGQALTGAVDDATALQRYHHERDAALREIFEITCALATFPPLEQFLELQKQLSRAIETQSLALADRPLPGRTPATV